MLPHAAPASRLRTTRSCAAWALVSWSAGDVPGNHCQTCLSGSPRGTTRHQKRDSSWGIDMSTRIALVDIDGTLFAGQTYMRILRWLWLQGWRRPRIAWLFASSLINHLLYKSGLVDRISSQERWAQKVAWLFKGAGVVQTIALMRSIWKELSQDLRNSMLNQVRRRRSEGFLVVLASAAVQPIVTGLVDLVDADAGVGTPLATRDGRYTGDLAGPLCSGAQKISYALDLELLRDTEVNWAASYAYSDSCFDLAMLEHVGHPVAVCPDPALSVISEKRGWELIPG